MEDLLVILLIFSPFIIWAWVKQRRRDNRTRRDLKIADKHYARQAKRSSDSVQNENNYSESSKALDIVAERYAKGEISKDEFEEIKATLLPTGTSVEGRDSKDSKDEPWLRESKDEPWLRESKDEPWLRESKDEPWLR